LSSSIVSVGESRRLQWTGQEVHIVLVNLEKWSLIGQKEMGG